MTGAHPVALDPFVTDQIPFDEPREDCQNLISQGADAATKDETLLPGALLTE
jgi:hypothetical protein